MQEFLTGWIWDFFADLAHAALNGILHRIGSTILSTPQLDEVPVVGQVWAGSQHLAVLGSVLVITTAGLIVMTYHTVHTRAEFTEILPRIVIAFVTANLSLRFGAVAIDTANALSLALVGGDQDGIEQTSRAFTDALRGNLDEDYAAPGSDVVGLFAMLVVAVMACAVLVTYIVRVALTVLLLVAAPLILLCHALPHTESIALWWWRAFAALLAIQCAQSLAFITTVRLFFLPDGVSLF